MGGNNSREKIVINDPQASGQMTTITDTLGIAASDETSLLTAGAAKVTFQMPYTMTISEIRATLTSAQTSGGILTINIKRNGVSLFVTKLTIDNNEKTSVTAATPWTPVDIPTVLNDNDEITADIDQVGVGGKGLKLWFKGTRAT